jgi:hypothetical protein
MQNVQHINHKRQFSSSVLTDTGNPEQAVGVDSMYLVGADLACGRHTRNPQNPAQSIYCDNCLSCGSISVSVTSRPTESHNNETAVQQTHPAKATQPTQKEENSFSYTYEVIPKILKVFI